MTDNPYEAPQTGDHPEPLYGVWPHCLEGYYQRHAVCPKCGGGNIEQTCEGYLPIDGRFADRNRATCGGCGWVGIVHDLKPKSGAWSHSMPRNED